MYGMTFPMRADEGLGRFRRLSLPEEVEQSVRLILTTRKGERPLRPKFGTDLDRFAFEGQGTTAQNLIRQEVIAALTDWEPRIRDPEVTFRPCPEEGKLFVSVSYHLFPTGEKGQAGVELAL